MGANSKIEWCHHTFNVWVGCTKVSEGCRSCYAESWAKRRMWRSWLDRDWVAVGDLKRGIWGPRAARLFPPDTYWAKLERWNRAAERAGERHRVFISSMADVLELPNAELGMVDVIQAQSVARRRLAAAIRRCTALDFLIVTKRPEHWHLLRRYAEWPDRQPIPNLWVLVSVENQEQAEIRVPQLLQIPHVAVRGLSCEPLLEPLELRGAMHLPPCPQHPVERAHGWGHRPCDCQPFRQRALDWVISGSESGPGARPAELDWFRSLRDQCADAGVPYFLKQLPPALLPPESLSDKERRKSKIGLPELDGQRWAQIPRMAA